MSNIKRAVSLYSYQDDYCRKRMTLDDIFKEMSEMGVEGVELISDQMIHNSPYPSAKSVQIWKNLVDKYGIKPICNDIFINSTLYRNRTLTIKEQIEMLKAEIVNAHNLGFELVRLVSDTDYRLIEPTLDFAIRHNVKMALEIHAGMSFSSTLTKAYLTEMIRLRSEYVGIVLDVGIFCNKHPRISREYFCQFGLNSKLADYIDNVFDSGSDLLRNFNKTEHGKEYPSELKKLIKSPVDSQYISFAEGYENTPFSEVDAYMPYVMSIHGKCYEMTEDNEEYSIPYGPIIGYLDSKDYDGYIATEYEGNRFVPLDQVVDSSLNVRRHQTMLKKYIDQLKKVNENV